MSPRGPRRGGLAHAQEEIASLVIELDNTLDLVNRLSLAGEEEAAAKLIDGQRAELYRVVNSISRNVAANDGATWLETMRKHATALAAAALLVISGLVAGVSAINRQTPADAAQRTIEQAQAVADPVQRIVQLFQVIRVRATLPPDQRTPVDRTLVPALQKALDEAKEEGSDDNEVVRYAEGATKDIQEGKTPQPPPAPSEQESPVESLSDNLDECVAGQNDADCI